MHTYHLQAQFYKVLMHPTRLAILDLLREGEQCVCHMEAILGLRQAHISQHLMVLREAGLVTDRRDGWNIFYRVIQPEVFTVVDAMNTFSGMTVPQPDPAASPNAVPYAKKKHCPCPKCNPSCDVVPGEPVREMVKTES